MPLYKEWNIDDNSAAAIWEIKEPEEFFIGHTGIGSQIKNERRRIEYQAGRFLLKHLKKDFPLLTITPDKHDKPRIEMDRYYFSISHSFPFIAAMVNHNEEAGIDIQVWRPHIDRIQEKFLSYDEMQMLGTDPELITLAWCVKEAAYKWQGRRGVEFIEHLEILYFNIYNNKYTFNVYLQLCDPPQMLQIEGIITHSFACAYVVNAQDWVIY